MDGDFRRPRTRSICEPVREAQDSRSTSLEVRDTVAVDCVIRRIGGRKSHPGFHRVPLDGRPLHRFHIATQHRGTALTVLSASSLSSCPGQRDLGLAPRSAVSRTGMGSAVSPERQIIGGAMMGGLRCSTGTAKR